MEFSPLHRAVFVPARHFHLLLRFFASVLFRRFAQKGAGPHLFWWGVGMVTYGIGTFTEAFTSLVAGTRRSSASGTWRAPSSAAIPSPRARPICTSAARAPIAGPSSGCRSSRSRRSRSSCSHRSDARGAASPLGQRHPVEVGAPGQPLHQHLGARIPGRRRRGLGPEVPAGRAIQGPVHRQRPDRGRRTSAGNRRLAHPLRLRRGPLHHRTHGPHPHLPGISLLPRLPRGGGRPAVGLAVAA